MVHRYALSALSPLAYIPENGAQIIDAGGVSAVKNTLQYHSGDPQVAISALSILWVVLLFLFFCFEMALSIRKYTGLQRAQSWGRQGFLPRFRTKPICFDMF